MATIKNQGVWNRYTPDPWPDMVPKEVMFSKRNSDGVDWYAFNHNAENFTANSAKILLSRPDVSTPWAVVQISRDATMLFPQDGALMLEVTDDVGSTDVQATYAGKIYTGGVITDKPVPPAPPVDLTQYAKDARYKKETSYLTVAGQRVAMDDRSKSLILGAYTAAQSNPSWTTIWAGVDGEFQVDATAITAIFNAMQSRINNCFTTYANVVAGISGGTVTTTAAIDEAFASVT